VSLEQVEAALSDCLSERPRLVSLSAATLGDVYEDVRRVAAALEVAAAGERVVAEMRSRLDAIAAASSRLPRRPTLATIEWISPLMTAGNWVPELVEIAGGESVFGVAGRHSPRLDWREVLAADPELLVAFPCGFPLDRTIREASALASLPGWGRLRAVRDGRVYLCEGNQFFNRPGPRLVESAEVLAEILHPERFAFGHEGAGWRRLGISSASAIRAPSP
jgi:iron complex transport system substrate-binding protein